jgi:tripartite-type tricarboxylate transporter receptor subunit TctC
MTTPRLARPAALSLSLAAVLVTTACGGSSSGGGGDASGYPDQNVEIVVPFAAGGPTDTVTRLIADPMADELGVQTIVQNVEGAGGTIGAADVANAEPDGYTLLVHHIGMSTAPALYDDLSYDPQEDFAPVGLITEVPMTIIARPDFEPDTFEELVDYITENGDTVTYANAGVGSASQLCGVLLERETGADVQEIPYDGAGPAIADVVGGQVDFMCDQTTNTTGQIQAGAVKAYAITTPERLDTLPDVPTTAEEGYPDLDISVWHGLYAPAGTPDEVIETLRGSLETALADQAVIDQMADLGTEPVPADQINPDAVRTKLSEQTELWASTLG